MRIVLIVACAAAFVFSVWSNTPTTADAKQTGSVSMDSISMMAKTASLPVEQSDAH